MAMKKNKLWWSIAWRFLRAKNQTQVINILTMLSIVAVAILIAAFVIIVSVFNGFDQHFKKSFGNLYPDIAVRSLSGRSFTPSDSLLSYLQSTDALQYAYVLETRAFANYQENQSIIKLRGVSPEYLDIVNLDINSAYDQRKLKSAEAEYCYFSFSTAESLGLSINYDLEPVEIQIPKNTKSTITTDQVASGYVYPRGAYPMEENQGEKDMLTDYEFIASLSGQYGEVSEIAIGVQDPQRVDEVMHRLRSYDPDYLEVLSRDQQNESLYKIINTERYMVYAILIFMLVLSSLNIIGVLLMTIIEKRRDIALMRGVGVDTQKVQSIFLRLGVLIGAIGVMIGLVVGLAFALGQQHFGWIDMNTNGFSEPFPVQVKGLNVVFIAVIGVCIAILASWLPSRYVDHSMRALRSID